MNREDALRISSEILNSDIEFRMGNDEVIDKVKSTIKYLEANLK